MVAINYGDIEDTSEQIDAIADRINDSFENIRTSCDNLVNNSYWTGSSSDNFASKFAEVKENFDELYAELKGSVTYLASVVNNYRVTERKFASRMPQSKFQSRVK